MVATRSSPACTYSASSPMGVFQIEVAENGHLNGSRVPGITVLSPGAGEGLGVGSFPLG